MLLLAKLLCLALAVSALPAKTNKKRAAFYQLYSFPAPFFISEPTYYQQQPGPSYYPDYPIPYFHHHFNPIPPMTAVVDLKNYGGDTVTGRLTLTQIPGGPVLLRGNVTGLTAGPHGIHIHEFGDLSKDCDSLGQHFNPTQTYHGGPADPYRHVGDLGNVNADSDGTAKIADSDHVISLTGPHAVVGRGLVVTSGKDDYGRGGDKESLRTGNSGTMVACGVIVWAQPPQLVGRPEASTPQPEPLNGGPELDAEQIEP